MCALSPPSNRRCQTLLCLCLVNPVLVPHAYFSILSLSLVCGNIVGTANGNGIFHIANLSPFLSLSSLASLLTKTQLSPLSHTATYFLSTRDQTPKPSMGRGAGKGGREAAPWMTADSKKRLGFASAELPVSFSLEVMTSHLRKQPTRTCRTISSDLGQHWSRYLAALSREVADATHSRRLSVLAKTLFSPSLACFCP